MGGFLRFLLSVALVLAILVLVVLPLALGPLLTSMVRQMGVQADTLNVSVALLDPTIVLGRSKRVEVDATNVIDAPARIAQLNLGVGDVSLFDRTFTTVSGTVHGVSITVGGDTVTVTSIEVTGPSSDAQATIRLSPTETTNLITIASRRAGVELDDVRFSSSGISVTSHGFTGQAQISVRGGALVLDPGIGGAVVLFQPAPSDPYALQEAWISSDGLNVRGTVDVARLARGLSG